MSDDFWNDYTGASGQYVKFNEVGDGVVGTITDLFQATDFNGNPCPGINLTTDDGEEKTVTAGQVMLKNALAEKRPNVGDKISITYSGVGDASPGRAPAKLFDVKVKAGDGTTPAPQPAHVPPDEAPF